MKKIISFTILSAFLFTLSCTKNDVQKPTIQESVVKPLRAVFKDWSEFEETIRKLDASNSDEYIMNWIFEKGHSSLYINNNGVNNNNQTSTSDEVSLEIDDFDNLTNGLLAIFNKDLEFQIGQEVVSYEDRTFYSQNLLDDQITISNSKTRIRQLEVKSIEGFDKIETNNSSRVNVWSNGGVGALQDRNFTRFSYLDCADGNRSGYSNRTWKYRQMLKAVSYDIGIVYNVVVYVECKLYINKRRGFRYATSRRKYKYNISGTVTFGNKSGNFNYNNYQRNCVGGSSSAARFNRLYLWSTNDVNLGYVRVSGSGTITHELTGNASNQKWTNYVNW